MGTALSPAGVMPTGWRPWARRVHRWVGMVLGLWLALVSCTGGLLVFRGEIEAALRPGLTRVTPGPRRAMLEDIHARVRQAHPEAVFRTVNLPTTPTASASWWGHDGRGRSFHVHANPYTGELLGVDVASGNVTEWLYLFHAQLLWGDTGEQVNGVGSVVWVLLLATGWVLAWPRAMGRWREVLTVRWGAQVRRRVLDLHRAVGVWAWVPLMVIVVTGAYFPFPAPFRWLASVGHGTSMVEDAPVATGSTVEARVTLDAVVRAADALCPGVPANWIRLPQREGDVFTVRKRLPGDWRTQGDNHVHVDPASGRVIRMDLHSERPMGQRVLRAMFPLHVGTFGGTTTRVIWAALGCVPAVLLASGAWLAWRRSHQRVAPAVAPGAPRDPSEDFLQENPNPNPKDENVDRA